MNLVRLLILLFCCHAVVAKDPVVPSKTFVDYTFSLSEVMLHDVVNPPAASRFYSYCMLAAYQAIYVIDKKNFDLQSALHVRPDFKDVEVPQCVSKELAATYAMLEVGRLLIPSGSLLEDVQKKLIRDFRKDYKFSSKCINENIAFASTIAMQVVEYSRSDGYAKLSALPRYSPVEGKGHWYPTPPEYMSAVEPHWRTIRTFLLDSAKQFTINDPIEFSDQPDSPFGKLMREVYDISTGMTKEQRAIAAFWDCNPFAVQYSGHAAIGIKKISPGGHWIGITGIACVGASASIDKTVWAHTLVALTLHDAFIVCWDTKFRSDRVRPESVITKFVDENWRPMLQTPPFPEYTSGHSVISTAAADVLTFIFNEDFHFIDTSEVYFGLPARKFSSFRQAADEAAISRLYGGIHFRDAIENGQQQGRKVGQYVVRKVEKGR